MKKERHYSLQEEVFDQRKKKKEVKAYRKRETEKREKKKNYCFSIIQYEDDIEEIKGALADKKCHQKGGKKEKYSPFCKK